jgi:hypothetical protein
MGPVERKRGQKRVQLMDTTFYLTAIHEECDIFVDFRIWLDILHGSYRLFGFFFFQVGRTSHTL